MLLKPIPKNSASDRRLPLVYQGISLLSTVGKLFSYILNAHLSSYQEDNGLIVQD